MTDLTLSQFKSVSKKELDQLLQQEEVEMHGGYVGNTPDRPTPSFKVRLMRFISTPLRSCSSLQRKFFPRFRLNSRF